MKTTPRVPDWTTRYRKASRCPLTQLIRFCRRNCDELAFVFACSALGVALSYGLFLAFIYALVNSPGLQP